MMAGRMHLLGHTRHPGMPTSGRYVYRPRTSDMQSFADVWYWQCDLHDDDVAQPDQYGDGATMRDAFAGALAHAEVCSARARDHHTHDSRGSRDACAAGHCDHATIVLLDGKPVRSTDPVEYNRRVHLGLSLIDAEPLVTICDCVEIAACWCDGVTECPPCASSGNRPHVCATAAERAAHEPSDPEPAP